MNIAEHVAIDSGTPVGVFSLELSAKELIHRLACSRARVDSMELSRGNLFERDMAAISAVFHRIAEAPLYIWDRGGLTLAQLTAQARRMKQRHGIQLVIVDYLGLVLSGERNRSRYEGNYPRFERP